jgi:peptide deformylase
MAVLPIRTLGDPVLRVPTSPVETFDRSLRKLADEMFEAMYAAPGVGLAAPQVGRSLRLFVYDDGDGEKGIVANGTLTRLDGEQVEEEGCLSIPGIYHETPRAMEARIEGVDVKGHPVILDGEGLLARIFQHETDHLEGMLFIDRLSDADRRTVLAAVRDQELEGGPSGSRGRFSRASRRR